MIMSKKRVRHGRGDRKPLDMIMERAQEAAVSVTMIMSKRLRSL